MGKEGISYEIYMPNEVSTYWYGKFKEFKENNPEFADLSYGEYLGEQILTNMMRLFDMRAAPETEVTDES